MDKTNPKDVKKAQSRNLLVAAIIILLGLLGLYYALSEHQPPKKELKSDEVKFSSPLKHVDEESYWLEHIQNKLSDADKQTKSLQDEIEALKQTKETSDEATKGQGEQYQQLSAEVGELKKALAQSGQNKSPRRSNYDVGSVDGENHGIVASGISEDTLPLASKPTNSAPTDKVSYKTPDTYVPSGSFVKAVMLGGADAAAGAISQANPSPMLFRIVDQGTLPNHKSSHLKGCVVTAAVIGDISSERGLIRLERMSCTKSSNEVVDMPVEGTVFGPEGKNGIRGNPIWREGALLMRAAAAGTLSGFSNALSQTYTTNSISPLGNTSTVNPNQVFQYGAAQGVGNAMDKLADYNIQRAEQYHPVIQLSAGALVDIVFLKGFYLDGKTHNEDEDSQSDQSTQNGQNGQNSQNSQSTTSSDTAKTNQSNENSDGNNPSNDSSSGHPALTLSPEQAARIKAHEEELNFNNKDNNQES